MIAARVDNPSTSMFISSSLSPMILSVAFSPFSKEPTKVLSLTYNSNAEPVLNVFWPTLSTIAVAPDVVPVYFLFSNNT